MLDVRSLEPDPAPRLPRAHDPDLALLERWRAGDRSAAEALFERHVGSLYRFFQHKCDGDIDELVQVTLVACLHARQQFRAESSFRTYLFTIARHELYRHLRARRRDAVLDFSVTSVAQVNTTLRSAIARDQAQHALLAALRELPLEQQMLLELHYWEDLDTVELGAIFEAPAATIRTWLFRARARLRELLAAHGPDAPAVPPVRGWAVMRRTVLLKREPASGHYQASSQEVCSCSLAGSIRPSHSSPRSPSPRRRPATARPR